MEHQPQAEPGERSQRNPGALVARGLAGKAALISLGRHTRHSPSCVASGGAGENRGRLHGRNLCDFYDGNLDPAPTVRALADEELAELVDALFVHLDSVRPAFGALSWFELAVEELRRRNGTDTAAG